MHERDKQTNKQTDHGTVTAAEVTDDDESSV